MPNRGIRRRRMQPLVAWRALRDLFRDPERTDLVFVIIRALSGNSLERTFRKVMADPVGRATLAPERSLLETLSDLPRLRALPEGTLGQAYAQFMDEEGLTAKGLVEASADRPDDDVIFLDPRAERLGERLRDMHDLWHVATGYHRDLLGEDALLAFTYAQTRNRGIGFIVLMATLELLRNGMRGGVSTVWEAYQRGRHAAFLPAADWETLLAQPLDDVRRKLTLGEPPRYEPVINDQRVARAA